MLFEVEHRNTTTGRVVQYTTRACVHEAGIRSHPCVDDAIPWSQSSTTVNLSHWVTSVALAMLPSHRVPILFDARAQRTYMCPGHIVFSYELTDAWQTRKDHRWKLACAFIHMEDMRIFECDVVLHIGGYARECLGFEREGPPGYVRFDGPMNRNILRRCAIAHTGWSRVRTVLRLRALVLYWNDLTMHQMVEGGTAYVRDLDAFVQEFV